MAITTNLDTLKINYLTQAQYDNAVTNNQINSNQLYFTPDSSETSNQTNGDSLTSANYSILLSNSANATTQETSRSYKTTNLTYNPNTQILNIGGNTNPKNEITSTYMRFTNSSGTTYDVKPTSIIKWDRTNNINTGWSSSTSNSTLSVAANSYAVFSSPTITIPPLTTYLIMATCSFPKRSTGGICTFGLSSTTSTTEGSYLAGFISTVPAQNDGTIYLNVCGMLRNTSDTNNSVYYLKAFSTTAATATFRCLKILTLYEGSY